ncbi:MAG: NAD(P)-dependent dehydrogenase, short-chain alcohol dehydrogenase family [Mucilaginibacter sp.]|nr:NAD(P)-dependent dehydrogenase, short-chain alcohol dehydrogenase family [Mucilaginibacter sp.]
MTFDLKNKTALITGGSRGIGRACAELLAASGAKVGITYNSDRSAAEETLAALTPGNHTAYQLEVQDPKSIETCVSNFIQRYGRIDALINNAGVYLEHKILEADFDTWQNCWATTVNINLTGPANLCYFAARQMAKQGSGKIINISSRGAFRGEPDNPAYGASKAGLNAMSQSLAVALAPHGISVHIIAPGYVATEMSAAVLASEEGEKIKQQSPFNRVAKPEEVARLAAIYISDGLEFTTGGIIDLNGASYLRS